MTKPLCLDCQFYKTESKIDQFGQCRRYPPKLRETPGPRWPDVYFDDSCGEFQKAEHTKWK